LKRNIKSDLNEQNKKISHLQNQLNDQKNTFEFCQSKLANPNYMSYQKMYSVNFELVKKRKDKRKTSF